MTERKRKWLEAFKEKGRLKYNDSFDYSLIKEYDTTHDKFPIRCNKHDIIFKIRPDGHLRVQGGCPICRKETNRMSLQEFIERASIKHNNKYDYSLITSIEPGSKVQIVCNEHGIFNQQWYKHLHENGCPECAKLNRGFRKRFYKNKKTTLYYIEVKGMYKIGITQEGLSKRYLKEDDINVIQTWDFQQGAIAYSLEKECLKATKSFAYKGPTLLKRGGDSELRTQDVLDVIKPIIEMPFQ